MIWSLVILSLAGGAARLPGPPESGNPWDAALHAPPLAKWDSYWYHRIAVSGYDFSVKESENSVGFYPAYPLVVRGLTAVARTPTLWTGIALSLLFLLVALLAIGDLFLRREGEKVALAGVVSLLFFPTSFFLAAFYSESLFLLAAAGVFWASDRKRWLLAGLCAGVAALTRVNGFLLVLPLAWFLWAERRAGQPAAWARAAAKALPPALAGILAYPVYLWIRFGDPLLYFHSKAQGWGKRATAPWVPVANSGKGLLEWIRGRPPEYTLNFVLETASAVVFVWLTILIFRRGLFAESLYAGATLLLLLCSANLDGFPRFVLTLFPCFLPIGQALVLRPAFALAYALGGAGLGAFLLYRFVHWIIVA